MERGCGFNKWMEAGLIKISKTRLLYFLNMFMKMNTACGNYRIIIDRKTEMACVAGSEREKGLSLMQRNPTQICLCASVCPCKRGRLFVLLSAH